MTVKSLTFKPQERKQRRIHMVLPGPVVPAPHLADSGSSALLSLAEGFLTADCIEACRRTVRRAVKRSAKLRIRLRPFLPLTTKPSEVRMGKGKGKVDDHVYPVSKGRLLFELSGVPSRKGRYALKKVQNKIPFGTRLVVLNDRG